MLQLGAPARIAGEVVIADERKPSHRAFPNMALLDNRDLLVVYRVGTDHHRTWDGDLVSRRSSGHGKTGPTRNRFCLTQGATSPRRKASFSYLTVACCYGLSNSGRVGARTPLQPLQR